MKLLLRYLVKSSLNELLDRDWLISMICDVGLFADNRQPYKEFNQYMNQDVGFYQYPPEFADFLLYTKDLNINSIVEIGPLAGFTTVAIVGYLKRFKRVKITCIDLYDWFVDYEEVSKIFNIEYLVKKTSFDIKGKSYDLCFIDGDHSYQWVADDYNNLGQYAKYCAIHDINDNAIRNAPETQGGNPRFWEHIIKTKKVEKELCYHDSFFGIGVL